jgi:hypothetical protein
MNSSLQKPLKCTDFISSLKVEQLCSGHMCMIALEKRRFRYKKKEIPDYEQTFE